MKVRLPRRYLHKSRSPCRKEQILWKGACFPSFAKKQIEQIEEAVLDRKVLSFAVGCIPSGSFLPHKGTGDIDDAFKSLNDALKLAGLAQTSENLVPQQEWDELLDLAFDTIQHDSNVLLDD